MSNSHFNVFWLVTKYGETYPLSNLIPSTYSISCYKVLPSATVIVPWFPTLSISSAIKAPISLSPLELMVAILSIYLFVVIYILLFYKSATTASTAILIPFLRSIGFNPASTDLQPSLKIALAKIVAVVVPSPASSLVLLATDFTS